MASDWPAVWADIHARPVSELLAGALYVAFMAQAANIAVVVCTAFGERDDVVWHGCFGGPAICETVPAERLFAEASDPLLNGAASAQPLAARQWIVHLVELI